jgi:hypothetical protein
MCTVETHFSHIYWALRVSHNTKIRAELQVLGHTSLFKLFQNFLVVLILFKLETGKSAEDTYEALKVGLIRHRMWDAVLGGLVCVHAIWRG